jgi:hypothetical protein
MVTRICVFAALLAGCGGPSLSLGGAPPQATAQMSRTPTTSSGTLVYVDNISGRRGQVTMFTFPGEKITGQISGFVGAFSPCTDAVGDVWVPTYNPGQWHVYEYAHGGTKPIATVAVPRNDGAVACSVDPTTGNLAVAGYSSINVFPGGVAGKPIHYSLGATNPQDCAYDPQGNLFLDAVQGSTAFFVLAELLKGGRKFHYFGLDKKVGAFPKGLIWDGQYMAVETVLRRRAVIYRFDVSGNEGHVVQVVSPHGLTSRAWFDVLGSQVIGTAGKRGTSIDVWDYPEGGPPTSTFSHRMSNITGLTISIAQ